MSNQASVHSIDALKEFRVALALYSDDTIAALGAVESELRRTLRWLQEERPAYWHDQIKKRRDQLQMAKAEVFKRKLQQRPDHKPAMSEQLEALRKAELSLQDAEKRLMMVRKWQPAFKQAALEYHGGMQRLKGLAVNDIPSAVNLLTRIIDALEAYLRVTPPSLAGLSSVSASASTTAASAFLSIATQAIDENEAVAAAAAANGSLNRSGSVSTDPDLDTLFADPGTHEAEAEAEAGQD